MHTVEGAAAALAWRVDLLEAWRQRAEPELGKMADQDLIEEAIAAKVREHGRIQLTRIQKAAGLIGIAAALASALHGWLP